MKTGSQVAAKITGHYGLAFSNEYEMWRSHGFGMRESLSRIRNAQRKGWRAIRYFQ